MANITNISFSGIVANLVAAAVQAETDAETAKNTAIASAIRRDKALSLYNSIVSQENARFAIYESSMAGQQRAIDTLTLEMQSQPRGLDVQLARLAVINKKKAELATYKADVEGFRNGSARKILGYRDSYNSVSRTATDDALLAETARLAAIAARAKTFKSNVAGVSKITHASFDEINATFVANEPAIVLVAEYFSETQKSLGALLVWKKYTNATHYEVFKKNIIVENSKFERVLFIDSISLAEETKNYQEYFKNSLDFTFSEDRFCIIFDPLVKEDRIYEYKIQAAFVPSVVTDVDFDSIVNSKKLGFTTVANGSNIFGLAATTFKNPALAWSIALLNNSINFFGDPKSTISILGAAGQILIVKDPVTILKIVKDSFALFGEKATLSYVLNLLGGLSKEFQASFLDSINEGSDSFSYADFVRSIREKIPALSFVLNILNSSDLVSKKELKSLNIDLPPLPSNSAESYMSVEGLTNIFNFVYKMQATTLDTKRESVGLAKVFERLK